jgi:hypothetical protein
MCVARLTFVGSLLVLCAFGAAQVARAAEQIMVRAGEATGPNAVFEFSEDSRPHKIVVRTAQLGVAGSRIEVTIDKHKRPAFSHVFTRDECKFGDAGSQCEVTIPSSNAASATILAEFRHGRIGHITIADAGVMKMDQTVSLLGFSKASRGGRMHTSDGRIAPQCRRAGKHLC